MVVLIDGRPAPADAAAIRPDDRGFLLGDGIFETMRLTEAGLRWYERHMARLQAGAAVIGLALPRLPGPEALMDLARQNGLERAMIRLTVSRGPAPRGVAPPKDAHSWSLAVASPLRDPPDSVSAIVSRAARRDEHSPLSQVKSLSYLANVLALAEAREAGAQEAILCNTAGRVAEGATANLVAQLDGRWITPPLGEGLLPGIYRGLLVEAGVLAEAPLPRAALRRAGGVLLISAAGARAVTHLDGQAVASGTIPAKLYEIRRLTIW